MKTMKRILALLLVLAIVFAFAACSKKDQIIGKWKASDDDYYMTFEKDGTLVMSGDGMSFEGTYKVDGDKLTMTIFGSSTTVKIKSVSGSQLVLVSEDGEAETFTKAK